AVMALLVLIPRVFNDSSQPPQNGLLSISYENKSLTPGSAPANITKYDLAITSGSQASFVLGTATDHFQLTEQEISRLKSLVLETGFMSIPPSTASPPAGDSNYTEYSLSVQTADGRRDWSWVSNNAVSTNVPPIVTQLQDSLESILKAHAERR